MFASRDSARFAQLISIQFYPGATYMLSIFYTRKGQYMHLTL
jgi:hypothetical protein